MMLPVITAEQFQMACYRANPVLYVERELGGKPSIDQAKLLMDCADLNNKYIIISAGRGAGKTWVVSWIVAWSMACLPEIFGRYDVNILGGSSQQSQKMNSYFKRHIEKTETLKNKVVGDPRVYETKFKQGLVKALKASDTSVRADHIDLLVLDEVCSASDALMESALPQITGARHGRVIMLSTPHKFFGLFRRLWDGAVRHGFKKYGPWSLEKCHWIKQDLLAFFKSIYSMNRYKVEILGEFPDVGHNVWPSAQIDRAVAGSPFTINRSFNTDFGVDWGQADPFSTVLTAIQYIDGKVYVPGPPRIWKQEYYMDVSAWITTAFKKERGEIVYCDASHSGENDRLFSQGCNVERIRFTTQNKNKMIEQLAVLLHQGKLIISPDNVKLIQELKEATWQVNEATGDQKIKKQSGNDDCQDSLLVGLWQLQDMDAIPEKGDEAEEFLSF